MQQGLHCGGSSAKLGPGLSPRKIKVTVVFGTRPEAIKMAPVVKELQKFPEIIETRVAVTAQHRQMLDQVLDLFGIVPDYDLNIMKDRQTLFDITTQALNGLGQIFAADRPDLVLVHGDTTTTFAGSLAAFYQQIPVGHVEAGLRTHNRYSPYPEEMNRHLTGALSELHFAPTTTSRENLLREGVPPEKIFITGNTVIDALLATVRPGYVFSGDLARILQTGPEPGPWKELGQGPGGSPGEYRGERLEIDSSQSSTGRKASGAGQRSGNESAGSAYAARGQSQAADGSLGPGSGGLGQDNARKQQTQTLLQPQTLQQTQPGLQGQPAALSRLLLVTTHRRENLGEPLREVYLALRDLLEVFADIQIVFPVHKNPMVREVVEQVLGGLARVHLVEPMDYQPFTNLMNQAALVLTDSGGMQEEAPALGKPVLVLRDTTERPEAVDAGTVKLVGTNRETVFQTARELLSSEQAYARMAQAANPYGDGQAARRTVLAIRRHFGLTEEPWVGFDEI